MKSKQLYVILLNYNGFNDTVECVKSLEKIKHNRYCKLKICVVDNNSSNVDERSKFSEFKKKHIEVDVIFNKKNNGYAAGNNVGIEWAIQNDADYIWVLNNDTIVDENVVDELLNAAEKQKAFFSTKIYNYYDRNEILYSGAILNNRDLHVAFKTNEIKEDVTTEFISGASIFASSKLWRQYKLPEEYFLYEEDVDFSLNLASENIPMYVVARATIFHKESASTNKLNYIKEYYFIRNKLILVKKRGKNPWKTFFFLKKFLRFPFRILRRFLKGVFFNKEYIEYTKYECKAYWDFINNKEGIIDERKQ